VDREIHSDYLNAGADIIETNTFSETTIAERFSVSRRNPQVPQRSGILSACGDDVALRGLVHEINLKPRGSPRAADRAANESGPAAICWRSMGPLPVRGLHSPDVNDPAFRAVSFDQARQTYVDQAKALLEGGCRSSHHRTVFDTLNGKAAVFAVT